MPEIKEDWARRAKKTSGFTLIELLIVVLIIAILAAIAVPNFLEFQTRAKVSRVKADMRSLATAIEAYCVDEGRYPIGRQEGAGLGLRDDDDRHLVFARLTSPVAYISSIPNDPFIDKRTLVNETSGDVKLWKVYTYRVWVAPDNQQIRAKGFHWSLRGVGPDGQVGAPYIPEIIKNADASSLYDPTNGTTSYGNIYRTNKGVLTGDHLQ